MTTHIHSTEDFYYRTRLIKNILLTCPLVLMTTSALSAESYFHRMLFAPSDSMLKGEAEGSIMIYDGLDSDVVDRFMDEQFDRIDSAMFVRIRHLQPNGEYLVEDDECD